MPMYQDLIEQVAIGRRSDYKSDIQPGATEEALQRLRQKTKEMLGAELPEGYINFLRITNGLNWDGMFIYSSEKTPVVNKPSVFMHPFVENNLEWRDYEPHKAYLFFADDEISLYVYNLTKGRYEILDRPSETLIRTFDTFEEMITDALKKHLQKDNDQDEEDE